METNTDGDAPPEPADLDGWRQAVSDGRYQRFRPEVIVAAIQDLGPHTDKRVLHSLAKHLSDCILRILRGLIGPHHPNRGNDIIDRVNAQLWQALLQPKSADGQALRVAFISRVKFRLMDAIAVETRAFENTGEYDDSDPAPAAASSTAPDVRTIDSQLDVESKLQLIKDPRKRQAFRLYMDEFPYKSTRSNSISAALGISEKTAREWIKEAQTLLKSTMGDQT